MPRSKADLTPIQARFIQEYLIDLNGKQAAIRAGYKPRGAEVTASKLLTLPKVGRAVAEGKARQMQRAELSAARVLEELRRMAFEDRTEILACKTVEDVRKLRPELRALVVGFEVYDANLANVRDGKTERVRRVTSERKGPALDMLARHFKLLHDVVELENLDALVERLNDGRRRARERKQKG